MVCLQGARHSEGWLGLSRNVSVGGINEFREFPEIKLIANFPNLIAGLRNTHENRKSAAIRRIKNLEKTDESIS